MIRFKELKKTERGTTTQFVYLCYCWTNGNANTMVNHLVYVQIF